MYALQKLGKIEMSKEKSSICPWVVFKLAKIQRIFFGGGEFCFFLILAYQVDKVGENISSFH